MIWEKILKKLDKRLESGETEKIDKQLGKGKEINVGLMNSKRYYGKGSNDSFLDNDATVGSLDEYDGETEVDIPSTAIAEVKYDPKTRVCNVLYVGGKKWYRFENMSPQQFKSFMNASSKGRYVNNVMRVKNRAKGF